MSRIDLSGGGGAPPAYRAQRIRIAPEMLVGILKGGGFRVVDGALPADARLVDAEYTGTHIELTVGSAEYPEAEYRREPLADAPVVEELSASRGLAGAADVGSAEARRAIEAIKAAQAEARPEGTEAAPGE